MFARVTEPKFDKPNRRPARDPLEAVPRPAPDVDSNTHDGGERISLKRHIPPRSRIARFFESRFGLRRTVQVNLDTVGSFFWRQVDGKRNLRTIARLLRAEFRLNEEKSRLATLQFTRDLMNRGLIQLQVPASPPKEGRR